MDVLLASLLAEPAWVVYAAVALVVLLEGTGPLGVLAPGELTALAGGASVALGATELFPMVLVVVAAAVAGDAVGFGVGRTAGARVLPSRLLGGAPRAERLRASLARRGVGTVALARWTAVVRTMAPTLAGASGMPYRRFVVGNALGAGTWGATSVVAGMLAGRSYEEMAAWLGGGGAVAVATVALVAGGLALHRRTRRRRAGVRTAALPA